MTNVNFFFFKKQATSKYFFRVPSFNYKATTTNIKIQEKTPLHLNKFSLTSSFLRISPSLKYLLNTRKHFKSYELYAFMGIRKIFLLKFPVFTILKSCKPLKQQKMLFTRS
jgi:hypothetical protein